MSSLKRSCEMSSLTNYSKCNYKAYNLHLICIPTI